MTSVVYSAHRTFYIAGLLPFTLNYTILPLFQRVFQMDDDAIQHVFIFIHEAEFNLMKVRRRGRNIIIVHRAILNVAGQHGDNIIMCATITQNGVLHRHGNLHCYNTAHILTSLDRPQHHQSRDYIDAEQMRCIIIWDTELLWSITSLISIHKLSLQ